MILYGDIETYSAIDLKQVGAQCYARHPSTEITLFAWAVGDGPVQAWDCTAGNMPVALGDAIRDADEYVFHNANFDRTVLLNNEGFKWQMSSRGSYMRPEKFHCTMTRAMAHGLPGALGTLGELYGLQGDEAKDKDGRRLVLKFCKPDKNGVRHTRETDPEDWARFVSYAGRDVTAMRHLYKRLPRINTDLLAERELINLDRIINDRGLYIDMDLVRGAIVAVDEEQARLRGRVQEQTDDMVESATKGAQLLAFILEQFGVRLPDLQASTLERRLEDDSIPEPVKELLRIRLEASRSSTAKYKVLARATTADNRLRGLLQIYGAQRTGRFSGRLFQPQNLKRPNEKNSIIEQNIAAIKAGVIEYVTPSVMESCANAIRGAIIAPPGKKLVVADLSNIEGRVLAWLAGEEWKLQAFRDFDAGIGHDLYALAYAKSFGITPEEVMDNKKNGDGVMRSTGKVQELALGFQGGAAAFLAFANVYRLDLEKLASQAREAIPADVLAEATDFYKFAVEKKFHKGMPEHIFVVCESLKRLWRAAHPHVEDLWSACSNAFRACLQTPNVNFPAGPRVVYRRSGSWVYARLPSGRVLCYPQAREEPDGTLTFMGINQYTRKWERIKTFGGRLTENCCQAAARDVITASMPVAEQHGYEIVLTVHDELVTEADDNDFYNPEHLSAIMCDTSGWRQGLPLAAAGYEGYRYRKD